ncbi:MAG: hypothetical protein WA347_00030 [Rhabdochlamydiaceae bacterium]
MCSGVNHFSCFPQVPFFPEDMALTIFKEVPVEDHAQLNRVCTQWRSFLSHHANPLWKPFLMEISPRTFQIQLERNTISGDLQSSVKAFFQHHRRDCDFILSLIRNDQELATCLHTNRSTLEEFKDKSAFERYCLTWKALNRDATPILITLINNIAPACEGYMRAHKGIRREVYSAFQKQEKFFSITISLIQQYAVPCNAEEIVYASLVQMQFAQSGAMILIANLVKSHVDLSGLKNRSLSLRSPDQNMVWAPQRLFEMSCSFNKMQTDPKNCILSEDICKVFKVDKFRLIDGKILLNYN